MRKVLQSMILWVIVPILSGCHGGNGTITDTTPGDTILLHYASNLTLIEFEDYTVAQLRNPWDTTKVLHTYLLVDKERELPDSLPSGTVVRTPLTRSVVYSSVHCSLLKQLGAIESIGGVCDLKYIKMPEIQEACQNGSIVDMGDAMSPSVERIIDLSPDALLLSPFENSGGYGRVEKLNIPIIECADYMETSALGRAEWMRFYGMLFGKRSTADSLFAVVERDYHELRTLAASSKSVPTVMCDLKSGATWYTPGGRSSIAGIYADAGASYIFREDKRSGSIPLPFETIFERGQQTHFWLIRYNQPTDKTYGELEQDFAGYAGFRAFRERNIYGCNTHKIPFYEEVPFRPELLLRDLIKIFHPGLQKEHQLRYFSKLAE